MASPRVLKMRDIKVSDKIAEFLEKNNIKYVFGIIGAGNAHIFDAISRRGFTEIICVHHEQSAVMAMGAFYRTSGEITATIVTTGAGTTNTITGLVSCWMDSIPGIIICGNEKSVFCHAENRLRIWGVQGFDSIRMVEGVSKYAKRILDPQDISFELDKSKYLSLEGRKAPVWLEIPMDIQGTVIDNDSLKKFTPEKKDFFKPIGSVDSLSSGIEQVILKLQKSKRPVIWLGHGIRLAGGVDLIKPLLEKILSPSLVTWQGIDMIESDHPYVFGRAGVYGQRYSNFVLQNSDFVLSIGTRMAIPQIGYDINELARVAEIVCVDIDQDELEKYSERLSLAICSDAKAFMLELIAQLANAQLPDYSAWHKQCVLYKTKFPVIGLEHKDEGGFINSYPLMQKISDYLGDDEVVVTDMGTALLSGFQVIEINKNKRLFTSTGLGEMGYGLPAAIGASFARNKGSVLCLNCDGGMMMNLQELQTIAHHQLPIKILVIVNDGYLMIKNTQKSIFKGRFASSDNASGVSCPDFSKLADVFNFRSFRIRTWDDVDKVLPDFLNAKGPVICEVFTHPEQLCVPKLGVALTESGEIISPPLEDLSPILPRDLMKENMIIGMHLKSEKL